MECESFCAISSPHTASWLGPEQTINISNNYSLDWLLQAEPVEDFLFGHKLCPTQQLGIDGDNDCADRHQYRSEGR